MSVSETPQIVLCSARLKCTVLPDFGGKISSLLWLDNGTELLQPPLGSYLRRDEHGGAAMPFSMSDAGGWDECLPSVAACAIDGASIPDHGDIWGIPWQVLHQDATSVKLKAHATSLPLTFTRMLHLAEASLELHYTVENSGDHPVPYLWSAHPLFSVDAGDLVRLPNEVRSLRVEGSKHQRLGPSGTVQTWPLIHTRDGGSLDLSAAQARFANIWDKVFAHLAKEGWAEIERRQARIALRMEFDPAITPYLGLWLCYGGWPDDSKPDEREQCIALEPTTADCDALSEALHRKKARLLAPRQRHDWKLVLHVANL